MESALELAPDTLSGREVLRDARWWDSVGALTLIALVDECLHVAVDEAVVQISKDGTLDDLLSLLGDKLES